MQPAAESGRTGTSHRCHVTERWRGQNEVATNLAIGLGTLAPMSVVIVDLDLQFGDVASGCCWNPSTPSRRRSTALQPRTPWCLRHFSRSTRLASMHFAPRKDRRIRTTSPPTMSPGFSTSLAAEFKYVVVDPSPGLGEHCLATLELATDGVWVCGMDVPSIRGLRKCFSVLKELQLLPQGRHTVLNFADRKSGLSVQDVEATIGVPIDTVIPRSRTLPYSTNRGIPILQGQRGMRRSRDYGNWSSGSIRDWIHAAEQIAPEGGGVMKLSERLSKNNPFAVVAIDASHEPAAAGNCGLHRVRQCQRPLPFRYWGAHPQFRQSMPFGSQATRCFGPV